MDGRKIEMDIVSVLAFSVFTAFSAVPSVQASTIYVPDDYETIVRAEESDYVFDEVYLFS
jgi:hypothetical protein